MGRLNKLRILLGIGGGISAYKTPDLVRRLSERGSTVRVVMTRAAAQFVTPISLSTVSNAPVATSLWEAKAEDVIGHIELARWADLFVIAPATADLIAKLAHGFAGDLLTTVALACNAPMILAPAMNHRMWYHQATQENVTTLRNRGAQFLGPEEGPLAEGESNIGRMVDPNTIARILDGHGKLSNRQVLVTAGPTREMIDPVRYLTNRSSGKMGYALARAAAMAGAKVTLISGPTSLPRPAFVDYVPVETASSMAQAVFEKAGKSDIFISAAAVSDFSPATLFSKKLKKNSIGSPLTLKLEPTIDILQEVALMKPRPYCVGFAAETEDLINQAREKYEKKSLDLVCANRVGHDLVFEKDESSIVLVEKRGVTDLGTGPKYVLATAIIDHIFNRLSERDQM